MGRMGWWRGACVGRHIFGALHNPARAHWPGCPGRAGRAIGLRPGRRGRMGAPPRESVEASRPAVCGYSQHSHSSRHHGSLRDGLRGLRPLRLPAAASRLHFAWPCRIADAGSGLAPRPGTGRPWRGRRLCGAAPGRIRQTRLLVAVYLCCGCHRGRLRPGARTAVAMACGRGDCARRALDAAGSRCFSSRGDRSARIQRPRRLRAGCCFHRMRLAVRATCRTGRSRLALDARPIGLFAGRGAPCSG